MVSEKLRFTCPAHRRSRLLKLHAKRRHKSTNLINVCIILLMGFVKDISLYVYPSQGFMNKGVNEKHGSLFS